MSSFHFNPTSREQYQKRMKQAGYVEEPNFQASPTNGYWCQTCEYLTLLDKSPTGYWCRKYKFPDRPNGCCNGWELKPQLRSRLEPKTSRITEATP